MPISPATPLLSEPQGDARIPEGTLGYFQARNKNRVYELVLDEFRRSGLTQADLARRLGWRPDVVCRKLGAPGNWTLDTVSDLLFAISGGEPSYSVAYPLDPAARDAVGSAPVQTNAPAMAKRPRQARLASTR